jgi:hypothetical protein
MALYNPIFRFVMTLLAATLVARVEIKTLRVANGPSDRNREVSWKHGS